LWGSLASCGRLSIGQLPHTLPDSGGTQPPRTRCNCGVAWSSILGGMRNRVTILALAATISSIAPTMAQRGAGPYAPTTESLRKHKVPLWFEDAKFGIFVHWGVFAVPAYHEWYVEFISPKAGFGFLFGGPPYNAARGNLPEDLYRARVREDAVQYHIANWGADFAYDDFIPVFKAEKFDPAAWADLFPKRAPDTWCSPRNMATSLRFGLQSLRPATPWTWDRIATWRATWQGRYARPA